MPPATSFKGAASTRAVDRVLAVVVTGLIPLTNVNVAGPLDMPVGILAGAALAPLWLGRALRSRPASALIFAFLLMAAGGLLCAALNADLQFDQSVAISLYALLLRAIVSVGVFHWTLSLAGFIPASLALAAGMAVNALAAETDGGNPWKYLYSAPITIAILAFAALTRRKWIAIAGAAFVMLMSAGNSYRSLIAIVIIACGMTILTRSDRRSEDSQKRTAARATLPILGLLVMFGVATEVLPRLLLSGVFGEQARQTTAAQIAAGGELITGGRVETYGSLALFAQRPFGFGPGVIPTTDMSSTVKGALADRGITASIQYIDTYMLGGRIKLHSIIADFWVNFGLATTGFVVVVIIIVMRFLLSRGDRSTPVLAWLLLVWLGWDLAFSPMYSNLTQSLFALVALAHLTRTPSTARHREDGRRITSPQFPVASRGS